MGEKFELKEDMLYLDEEGELDDMEDVIVEGEAEGDRLEKQIEEMPQQAGRTPADK